MITLSRWSRPEQKLPEEWTLPANLLKKRLVAFIKYIYLIT